jgi:sugar lactone lactonase YvrE
VSNAFCQFLSRFLTFKCIATWCGIGLAAVVATFAAPVNAQTSPEVQRGLTWLQSQVQADGSLVGSVSSVGNSLQAQSEALYTLRLLNAPGSATDPLQAVLGANNEASTEYIARRAWALGFSGSAQPALIRQLEQRQSQNTLIGGYGGFVDYSSHSLDTAFVLLAQKAATTADTTAVANALTYLSNAKTPDGSFAVNKQASIYATTKAILAAAAWSSQTSTGGITLPATRWLLAQRNTSQHYGNSFHNALALWALTGQTSDVAVLNPLMSALISQQLPNGSWNDDPYLTSIALRALYLVSKIPPAPTTGAISGIVIDASSAVKLADVVVQVLATPQSSTTSDASGSFAFSSVTPGTFTLRLSKLGYASKDVNITLAAGQNLNIGNVGMAQSSITASLNGVIRDQAGNLLSDAIVTVGSSSVLTSSSGTYQINDLSPGVANITVGKANYQTANAQVLFVAGSNYNFSPRLYSNGSVVPSVASLTGIVVDSISKVAIANATVQLGTATQTTNATGVFTFNPIVSGTFALAVSVNGYQTVTASGIAIQGVNNLGSIALVQLPPLVTALNGTVRDEAGAVLSAVKVSIGAQSVLTDSTGTYQITGLTPGLATITATKTNFQTATATVSVVAGSSYNFSPRLYAIGVTPPSETSLTGAVVDTVTKLGLANATVQLGTATQTTGPTGAFTFNPTVSGAFALTISANGYQTLSASGVAVGGINNVGNISLAKLPANSNISGVITDASTNLPLNSATVSVQGQGSPTLTGLDGRYNIAGLYGTSFTLNVSSAGYLPQAQSIALTQVGTAVVDVKLLKQDVVATDISFIKVATNKSSYPASGEIALDLILGNNATSIASVLVSAQVTNTQNSVVYEYLASPVIGWMGKTYGNNPVNIAANGTLELHLDWNTLRLPAGAYSVSARAEDGNGRVVAQGGTTFVVAETSSLVGGVTADPPLAQAGAQTPISLTADLVNNGNLTLPAGDLQLRVTLDAADTTVNQQTQVSLRSFSTGSPLKSLTKLVADSQGNLYTVNQTDGNVNKIDSVGVSSVVATLPVYGQYSDLARDGLGNIWVTTLTNKLYKISPTGVTTTLTVSSLSQIHAIDITDAGVIYLSGLIASESRLVQRDAAGVETVLWRNGLVSPEAMVKDQAGNYVVTNSGDGTLVKVSAADGVISPFVSGLNQPKGITIDAVGNYYVANAGNNTIVKVTATGLTSTYAIGFNQPYDLKFDGAGNLFVSNAGDDSILKVSPNGSVQLFAKGIANSPQGMKYDVGGNLWIVNDDGTLRKKDTLDNVSVVATGLSVPRGIAIASNGDVFVAEYGSGKVSRISNGVKTSFATGLASPWGIALDAADNVYVTEVGVNRITRFDSQGIKLSATESLMNSPSALRTDSNGDVYIQNSGFLSIRSAGTVKIAQRNFNYSYWVPDAANGGVVALNGYSVVRVDAAGVVTTLKSGLPFYPYGVAIDTAGSIVLNDYSNKKLYKLDNNGTLAVFATMTAYVSPGSDLQADSAGNLIVRFNTGEFSKVTAAGVLVPVVHTVPSIYGWSVGSSGQLIAWSYDKTYRVDTSSGATSILLSTRGYYNNGRYISGAALDGAGNLVLSDTNTQNLSVYSSAGVELNQLDGFVNLRDIVWTGSELRFVDAAGRLYGFTDGNYPVKKVGAFPVQYLAQKGADTLGAATSTNIYKWVGASNSNGYEIYASFSGSNLAGVAVKGDGGLAIASYSDSRVIELDANKAIVKDYAGIRTPQGLAFDSVGRLYVANFNGANIARFDSLDSTFASTFAKLPSYPQNLAFDATGQLIVVKAYGGIDRVATNGVVSTFDVVSFKGLLLDGAAVFAIDQSNSQLRKRITSTTGSTWDIFATGLARPVAVRAGSNGDVFVLNQSNNTVAKYNAGKLDTVASVPAGMNAIGIAPDGVLTVVGNGGVASSIAVDGKVTDLSIAALVNQWALSGVAKSNSGKLYLATNDPYTAVGAIFEVSVSQPAVPPTAGTVVYQTSLPMASMPADGAYVHYDFGTWVPPYGGDFKVEVTRTGVAGQSTNYIHVGANAQSLLSSAKSIVPPGNSALEMCLDIKGADFTSISRVELSQVRPVSKSGVPRGMAGDRDGNLYVTDFTTLYKTNAAGQSVVIATGMQLAFGLATDSQQNFYVASKNSTTARFDLIRINLQGTKTVVVDLGVTTANGVQVNSKDEILVGSVGKLLKVSQLGVVSVVTNTGLSSPRGIAVDGRDNVYVQNEGNFVSMVKPDGSSVSIFSKGDGVIEPSFEGDGYPNIAADCADNFYIAPYQWGKIGQYSEEHSIAQVVPRTGRIALLFDAQKIDPSLGDIDYLAFDRFSNRILMYNDYDQRIWQVPVTCGAIGVQAHLLAKPGQVLTGSSKPPSATVPRADGRTEYVWSLRDVTAQGAQICFNASLQDVKLGQELKSIDSGFISFQNSFTPGEVTVPLAIPLVRAGNLVNIGVTTDLPSYPANAAAQVSVTLNNANSNAVVGSLNVQVFDGRGVLVGNVTQQAVSLPAGGGLPVSAVFDIASIVPAPYTVKAVLSGVDGDLAAAQTVFNVLPSNANTSAKSTVSTDRKLYNTSDRVVITSNVTNQSANIVLENLTLAVQVFNVANTLQYSYTHTVPQLAPAALRNYAAVQTLVSLPQGTYTVKQTLSDSQGRVLDQPSTIYTVDTSANTGFGLRGQITATPSVALIGQNVALALTVNNNGNAALASLPITIRVIDPQTGNVLATYTQTLASLTVGQSQPVNATWPSSGIDGQTLIAVASASLGGQEITLAQAPIRLQGAPLLRVAPAQLNFGSVNLGQSTASQIITVSSIGSQPVQSLSFVLGGVDPTAFIVQGGTCLQGMSLPVNASCTLSVAYQPSQSKTHTATLSFGHAAAGTILESVSLTGQAIQLLQQLESLPLLPKDARILVLASCQQSSNSDGHEERDDEEDEGHRTSRGDSCTPQPEKASCTSERALAIGQYLDGLGILNKVVTDEASFRHQMRCGGYNTYWISGGASKIEHGLVKEVREAVWRGDGLIIDGQHDDRNLLLDAVAGVKFRGKLPGTNYTAHIPAGSVFAPSSSSGASTTSTLATLGQPARYELLTGTAQASFTARTSTTPTDHDGDSDSHNSSSGGIHDSDNHSSTSSSTTSTTRTVPAIIANRYGAGKAMVFAFDLAAMVTLDVQQTATVNLPLEKVVLATAAQLGAASSSTGSSSLTGSTTLPGTLTVGDISAQGVLMHNLSNQTITAQVSISLPAQLAYSSANLAPASVVAASGTGSTASPAQVHWTIQLAPQQSTTLTWRVRVESVAAASATYTIPVQVSSLGQGASGASTSTPQATYSFTLHAVSGAALVQAALPAVQALQPVASAERNAKTRVLAAIASATSLHNQGRYAEAIDKWIEAANALMSLTALSASSPSNQALVAAARTAVSLALEASTDGQCQALICLRGDLALSTSTPVLGTSLGITRSLTNSCPAPLKDLPVVATLTHRRTQQNLFSLADSKLDLTVGQTNSRTASAPVQAPQAQVGDWLDALLTAQWQGHNIEMATRTAQVTAPILASCPAGGSVSTSRFTAFAEAERLDVRAGKPGNANPATDWEWGLGANTTAAGQFSAASLDWTSGSTYYWTVTTEPQGKGVFTVRNGTAIVAQGSYDKAAAPLRSGNAIRISVTSASDVGSAKIAASLLKIEGQSVSHSVLTTAANQSNSLVITHPTLANGMSAEGTVRLDFTGSAPPLGSKLNFRLSAGTVQCP